MERRFNLSQNASFQTKKNQSIEGVYQLVSKPKNNFPLVVEVGMAASTVVCECNAILTK